MISRGRGMLGNYAHAQTVDIRPFLSEWEGLGTRLHLGQRRFIPWDWCCSVELVSDPELKLSVSLASETSSPIQKQYYTLDIQIQHMQ